MAARVVWVTASPPDHDGTGGQLRQAHLLDATAERAEVVLVVAGEVVDAAVRDAVAAVHHVAPGVPLTGGPGRQGLVKLGRSLGSPHPLDTARAAPVRRRLAGAARSATRPGDVVVVEHLELAPLLRRLDGTASRTVLTIHHAAARQARQHRELATSAARRAWWREQERRFRALERRAGRDADVVVTVSPLDAEEVACASTVVPNGTPVPPEVPPPPPGDGVVVLTGALDYWPNVDGARWFVEAVWPRVRADCPDARLQLVGRRPHPDVVALTSTPGVTVHPDVPVIDPWIAGADVCVVPLRLGGGTRLKALQGLAAGRPVVGTRVGLEGLDLVAGRHALVADDPAVLATHVVTCLAEPDRARALAVAGHAWVAEHHDWSRIGARFAIEVLGLAGQATSPSTSA